MNTDNDLAAVESRLINRLLSNIPVGFTAAQISVPNASFTTPNATPWMRCTLQNFGPIDQDASACYEVNEGVFTIGIFYPKGTGSQAALSLAKTIKSLYTAEIFDDVVIESVRVNPTSEPDNSPWYGVNVVATYTFEGHTA